MSQAHKGSRLIVQDSILAVPFDSAHFDYNEDTAGIQRGCLVIPIGSPVYTMRPFEGKFDGAIAVEQGTTNLVAGQAIVVYNNYSVSGNITTTITTLSEKLYEQNIVRITYQPTQDANRDHMRTSSSGHGCRHNGLTFASGNTYYASIYWRSNKSSVTVVGAPSNITGWGSYVTYPLSNGWNRSVARWSSNGNGTDSKFWGITDNTINTNEVITVDWACPQIEQMTFPTSYVNGTRASGAIKYPSETINKAEGTISCWIYMNEALGNWRRIVSFIGVAVVNSQTDLNFDISTTGLLRLKTKHSPSELILSTTALQVNKWHFVACSWGSDGLKVYIDGNLEGQANYFTGISEIDPNNIGVGERQDSTPRAFNGLIDELRIDKHQVTDEEIMAWYVGNSPFFNQFDNRGYAY